MFLSLSYSLQLYFQARVWNRWNNLPQRLSIGFQKRMQKVSCASVSQRSMPKCTLFDRCRPRSDGLITCIFSPRIPLKILKHENRTFFFFQFFRAYCLSVPLEQDSIIISSLYISRSLVVRRNAEKGMEAIESTKKLLSSTRKEEYYKLTYHLNIYTSARTIFLMETADTGLDRIFIISLFNNQSFLLQFKGAAIQIINKLSYIRPFEI